MSSGIDKKDIARSFGSAAASYDSAAHFQRRVGNRLFEMLPDSGANILDLGCGTGFFVPRLKEKYPAKQIMAMDLSDKMLSYAKEHRHQDGVFWCAGDADHLPLRSESIDTIYSSLALQWCFDLDRLFGELHRVLTPGGVCVFSTLLDQTLYELKTAWENVDLANQHVNDFFSEDDYRAALQMAGFDIPFFERTRDVLWYDSVRQLTTELKHIGAHNVNRKRSTHLTGKSRVRSLINGYETFRSDEGRLPATYYVAYFGIRKPEFEQNG